MSAEIFEIPTPAGPILVEADTGSAAVGFVRRGLKARRLTGAEARALSPNAIIHKATEDGGEPAPEPTAAAPE